MIKTHLRRQLSSGYTLIEVLVATAVVTVSMAAAISLSSSMVIQEELAWRTAITRNYQENMARLWQLGLSPAGITAIMPTQANSDKLQEAIYGDPTIVQTDVVDIAGMGKMQKAVIQAFVNVSSESGTEINGSDSATAFTITAYRPYLPETLRTPARQ